MLTASASGLYLFEAQCPTPPILYLRFAESLTVAAQDSRPSGSLLLSCKALPSSTSCRLSGKAMARTGLRMMPTFPSPPLKFRTAGFPQYGFKADISDDAFLSVDLLKPAPGVRNATYSLLSSFVSSETGTCDPVLSRAGFLFRYRH